MERNAGRDTATVYGRNAEQGDSSTGRLCDKEANRAMASKAKSIESICALAVAQAANTPEDVNDR